MTGETAEYADNKLGTAGSARSAVIVVDVARLLHRARDMTRARVALGRIGEDLACRELEARGYIVLERRYRRRGGEIDIIARDGEAMVFVEVKAREGKDFGEPAEAVTVRKRRRMTQVALEYLARHRIADRPCRFDVVAIDMGNGRPLIELYQNAFDAVGG